LIALKKPFTQSLNTNKKTEETAKYNPRNGISIAF
jgi:hypothetical protein